MAEHADSQAPAVNIREEANDEEFLLLTNHLVIEDDTLKSCTGLVGGSKSCSELYNNVSG